MKTYLITGATAGIGEACARRCLEQGDRVIVMCRSLAKAQAKFGPELESGRVVALEYDFSDNSQLFDFCRRELKDYTIERVIHCAGFTQVEKFTRADHELILKLYETHVFSLMEIVRALLRLRKSEQELSVVALSSVAAQALSTPTGAYSMAKASLDYYVRMLNKVINVAPQKRLPPPSDKLAQVEAITDPKERQHALNQLQMQSGLLLRINSYNPSSIKTDIFDYDFAESQGRTLPVIPMSVVVDGVLSLLENPYISGQCVVINNDAAY